MLHFISFGSGSSGNCYYLYTDTDGLLIDAGVGIRSLKKRMHDYGHSLHDIHHILLTHDHADHAKAVGALAQTIEKEVWATSLVFQGIEQNYCIRKKVPADYAHVIKPGDELQLGEFKVEAFPVPHDSFDNVGYRIEAGGVVFCLMTDVGHLTDRHLELIGETNYLVIEANHDPEMLRMGRYPEHLKVRIRGERGHLSNQECAEALAKYATPRLRHVWLCHLSNDNNHPDLALKTVNQILYQHGIVAGADFKVDVLNRVTPTGPFLCE